MKNKVIEYLDINDVHKIETKLIEVCDRICLENGINYVLVCGSALGAVRNGGPIPWDTDADMTIAYRDRDKFIEAMKKGMPDWCGIELPGGSEKSAVSFPRVFAKGIAPLTVHLDIFTFVGLPESFDEQVKYSKKSDFLNKLLFYKKCGVRTKYYDSRNSLFSFFNKVKRALLKVALLPLSGRRLLKIIDRHYSAYDSNTSKFVMNPAGHYGTKNILERKYYDETVRVPYDSIEVNLPKDYEGYLKHYYKDWQRLPAKESCEFGFNLKIAVTDDTDLSFLK